jgi:hypothetical protein
MIVQNHEHGFIINLKVARPLIIMGHYLAVGDDVQRRNEGEQLDLLSGVRYQDWDHYEDEATGDEDRVE